MPKVATIDFSMGLFVYYKNFTHTHTQKIFFFVNNRGDRKIFKERDENLSMTLYLSL